MTCLLNDLPSIEEVPEEELIKTVLKSKSKSEGDVFGSKTCKRTVN